MADGNFDNAMTEQEQASPRGSLLLQIVPEFEKIEGWLKLEDSELLFAAAASVPVIRSTVGLSPPPVIR